MSPMSQHEAFVRKSLFEFIMTNMPSVDLNDIDDIVLSYVTSILGDASSDTCFDVEGFFEMMSAYIPEFAAVEPAAVCDWLMQLELDLVDLAESHAHNHESADKVSLTMQSITELLPPVTKNRSHSCSESSEPEVKHLALLDFDEYGEQCAALHEMFPNTSTMEIKHCVSIALGDLERAAGTLLHRREIGQALVTPLSAHPVQRMKCDDSELKSRIIARYSYVDKNSGMKEHRPLAPKYQPKKLVRYRDNKIVSLKGERYTEVPKAGADEEHLKKPKKQHCP